MSKIVLSLALNRLTAQIFYKSTINTGIFGAFIKKLCFEKIIVLSWPGKQIKSTKNTHQTPTAPDLPAGTDRIREIQTGGMSFLETAKRLTRKHRPETPKQPVAKNQRQNTGWGTPKQPAAKGETPAGEHRNNQRLKGKHRLGNIETTSGEEPAAKHRRQNTDWGKHQVRWGTQGIGKPGVVNKHQPRVSQ